MSDIDKVVGNPVCPLCYSRDMIKFGFYKDKQRWMCLHCKHTTTVVRKRKPKNITEEIEVKNGEK